MRQLNRIKLSFTENFAPIQDPICVRGGHRYIFLSSSSAECVQCSVWCSKSHTTDKKKSITSPLCFENERTQNTFGFKLIFTKTIAKNHVLIQYTEQNPESKKQ